MRHTNQWVKLHLPKMRLKLLLHVFVLFALEVSKMQYPTDIERYVRIRRKIEKRSYLNGKSVYTQEKLRLTIPSRYKEIVEPFLNKDLKVEAKREGKRLIITAKPV